MADLYSESILASYVTYKELYASDSYRSAYQILAEFIKYQIASEEIYSFSVPELKKKLKDTFGFQLPDAVIKSALKKLDYVERIQHREDYSVNRQNLKIDPQFIQYRERAEKENSALTERLLAYAEEKNQGRINKEELVQELVAYLLDESNGGKYQEVISTFILENSSDEVLVNQLNSIREGSILYLGLNCNISETGSITHELTLYLDMEILFDIYGYNGEVYKSLANDLILLVKEANKSSKKIKLKYFEDTKREILAFFLAATEIVKTGTYLRENVAMKAIVNGCKDATDVSDKESDFFHKLQYGYGITLDERKDYYTENYYEANLEGAYVVDDEQQTGLKLLSNINKLRKNQMHHDYAKVGYLFVTETWKTLDLSKKICEEFSEKQESRDEGDVCRLAVDMSFLTNFLWYKLNQGFGAIDYPHNLDSVIKAKIVLANFISQNVSNTYNRYKKEYNEGALTADQMAGRLLGLREKASKPEEITVDNLSDNLNFDPNYLCRYEEERELQRIKLEEKEEIIQQLMMGTQASQDELIKVKSVAESSQARIMDQDAIIAVQKAALEEKDKLLERYQNEEKEALKRKQKNAKIRKFVFAILIRMLIVAVIGVESYFVARYFKADVATSASIVVTVISIIIGGIDVVRHVYHKIFKEENCLCDK